MTRNEGFRKYLEAGSVLGHVTRARAEEIVRELVGTGEIQRGQAQQWADDLVARSRKAKEHLAHLVRTEVSSQLASHGTDPERLARQVADILKHSAEAGRKATQGAAGTATASVGRTAIAARQAATRAAGRAGGVTKAATAAAKKATKKATKQASAKRAGARVAGARVAAAQTAAKAAPTKKAVAKQAVKKAPAKKAPAKRVATKQAGKRAPSSPHNAPSGPAI